MSSWCELPGVNLARPSQQERTNRETMSICMLFDKPHAMIPMVANSIADWFAPLLPITLLRRPYNGVNVQVASKYLRQNEGELDL